MNYVLILSISLTPALAGTDKGMSGLGLLTVAPAINTFYWLRNGNGAFTFSLGCAGGNIRMLMRRVWLFFVPANVAV